MRVFPAHNSRVSRQHSASGPAPALYDVTVTHTRHVTMHRIFRHHLYTWLVDLDALPRLPLPLRPLARFDARDHLGDPRRSIRRNLDDWLAEQGMLPPDEHGRHGKVLMLAHARVLGYVFNPITVYWCFTPDDELRCLVAEVHNTYGQRHRYLVLPDADGNAEVDKQFPVSPFLPEDGHYRMRFGIPGDRVNVRVDLYQRDRPLLTASLSGRRIPASNANLLRMLLRRPLVPHRVSALIRRHGVALWLRGAPRFPKRPRRRRHNQEAAR